MARKRQRVGARPSEERKAKDLRVRARTFLPSSWPSLPQFHARPATIPAGQTLQRDPILIPILATQFDPAFIPASPPSFPKQNLALPCLIFAYVRGPVSFLAQLPRFTRDDSHVPEACSFFVF